MVVILTSTDEVYFESRLSLAKQLEAHGNTVLKPVAFEPGSIHDAMLREVRQSGNRIVLVLAFDNDTQAVASQAHQDGMSAGFAWGRFGVPSVPALFGWIWIKPFLASEGMQEFAKQVCDYSKLRFSSTVSPDSVDLALSAALHDAIMLYAHAATKVLSEGGELQDGEAVTKAVRSTSLDGVGGTVMLDSKGDRIESYEVMNYVLDEGDVMRSVAVGMFNSTKGLYEAYERAVVWPDHSTSVPPDYVPGNAGRLHVGLHVGRFVLSQFFSASNIYAVMLCSDLTMRVGQWRAIL